jgi:hypothetical protein
LATIRHGLTAAATSIWGALFRFRPDQDSSLARRLFIGLRLSFDADQGSGIGKTLLRLSRRPPHRPFSMPTIVQCQHGTRICASLHVHGPYRHDYYSNPCANCTARSSRMI